MQLAERRQDFEALGVNVAGMTYDDVSVLAAFHAEQELGYPLLQDENVKHIGAYGVLNTEFEPGDNGYGIPYPGILYVDRGGRVLLKFAVPGFRQRPPLDEVLAAIAALQQGP